MNKAKRRERARNLMRHYRITSGVALAPVRYDFPKAKAVGVCPHCGCSDGRHISCPLSWMGIARLDMPEPTPCPECGSTEFYEDICPLCDGYLNWEDGCPGCGGRGDKLICAKCGREQ